MLTGWGAGVQGLSVMFKGFEGMPQPNWRTETIHAHPWPEPSQFFHEGSPSFDKACARSGLLGGSRIFPGQGQPVFYSGLPPTFLSLRIVLRLAHHALDAGVDAARASGDQFFHFVGGGMTGFPSCGRTRKPWTPATTFRKQ